MTLNNQTRVSRYFVGMILELLKFAVIFFLPTIIGRAFGFYHMFRKMNFSWMSWRNLKWTNKLASLVGIGFLMWKLASMFLYGHTNFYLTIQTRMDSPSYIIRSQYRTYLADWENSVPEITTLKTMKAEGKDLSEYPDKTLLREFEDMEFLSEQLKMKEKKKLYSKFGEYAFLRCKYCSKDLDYILFLIPGILLEYAIFLVVVGVITSQSFKSKWRGYAIYALVLSILVDVNYFYFYERSGLDLYAMIFGEDFFTLLIEKAALLRDSVFVIFVIIFLIFDFGQDSQINDAFVDITRSLEASLALLQSTRLQKAAISLNEDLKKFSIEAMKKHKFKFADIVSDPSFRAKVAESGSQLEMERIIQQHGESIEKLLSLSDGGLAK